MSTQGDANGDPTCDIETEGSRVPNLPTCTLSNVSVAPVGLTAVATTSSVEAQQAVKTNMTSAPDPLSFLTVQNQNGQVLIQQPMKTNGPTLAANNLSTIPKGHIVVKQRPASGANYQQIVTSNQQQIISTSSTPSSSTAALLTDVDRSGVKRPLTNSSNNVITKVIITKNPLSGQPQPLPAGSSTQNYTLTSVQSSSSLGNGSNSVTVNQIQNSAAGQSGTAAKNVSLASQGGSGISPGKTVIATIPSGTGTKINMPYHKIPISPTKITMIPVSRSPNKQTLNSSSITVLSRALNTLAQSGNVAIKPGSPSKVIIKQGPAVSI